MTRRMVMGLGFGLALVAGPGWSATEAPALRTAALAQAPEGDVPYAAAGRRDPFRPPRASAGALDATTPLQRFELGQLRLVAVIYDTAMPRAVVEDEAGLGYIVKVGTPIGPNGGAVHAIERGRVVVHEDSQDYYGETQASEVVLELDGGDERGKQ